jgi:hypothetical protein
MTHRYTREGDPVEVPDEPAVARVIELPVIREHSCVQRLARRR